MTRTFSKYPLLSSNGIAVRFGIYLPINFSGRTMCSGIALRRARRKVSAPGRRRLLWKGTLTFRGIVALPRWRANGVGFLSVWARHEVTMVGTEDLRVSSEVRYSGCATRESRTPARQSRLRSWGVVSMMADGGRRGSHTSPAQTYCVDSTLKLTISQRPPVAASTESTMSQRSDSERSASVRSMHSIVKGEKGERETYSWKPGSGSPQPWSSPGQIGPARWTSAWSDRDRRLRR